MKLYILLLGVVFLAGCQMMDTGEKIDIDSSSVIGSLSTNDFSDSELPVKKLVILSAAGKQEFDVEVALTDEQRQKGLMNRDELLEHRGMLFVFEKTGFVKFWMKNTLIPLDMLFIDEDGYIQHIVYSAAPCLSKNDFDCPKYGSEKPVRYVLEINAGLATKLEIHDGDRVAWL